MRYEDEEFLPDEEPIDWFITFAMRAALAALVVAVWMIMGGLG